MKDNEILDNFDFEAPDFQWDESDQEVVGKYYSNLEAQVAAARLRSEGIPCFVANETAQSVVTSIQIYLRLHVRPEDAQQARELLAEAAIDMGNPEGSKSGNEVLLGLVVLIVILMGYFLFKAMSGE